MLQPAVLGVPGTDLDAYLRAVSGIAVLSAEQEHELAVRFVEEGDLDAARQLVLAHLRFVAYIAKGYAGYGLSQADLIQEGNLGLMKAVKRFDPNMGVRLVSFAVHWIKAEIHEFVLRNWRIVKIATTKAQRKLFFNLRSMKKRLGLMNNEEIETVAKELGVGIKDVRDMEARLAAHDAAFDGVPGQQDSEEGHKSVPSLYLEDESANPALHYEAETTERSGAQKLTDALEKLDHRSQEIIKKRWLAEKKATLHELADAYGVSAERIRQLEKNAMGKLKAFITIPV